jgi:hypothetical protein
MKALRFLVIFFLLPHSLFSMHLSKSPSKTAPRGRDFFAQQAKKNLPNGGVQWRGVEIEKHREMLKKLDALKKDKQRLKDIGVWPKKEGRALKKVLEDNAFCSHFELYASQEDSRGRLFAAGGVGSGLTATILAVSAYTGLVLPATCISSIYCFYKLRGVHSNHVDLTNIAIYDRKKLVPAYSAFEAQLKINKD